MYAEIHNSATFRFLSDSKLSDYSLFQVSAGKKKKSNLQKAGKKEKNKAQTQLRKYFYVVSMMTCLGFEELMSLKWSLAQ